jgi:hypothetical protein
MTRRVSVSGSGIASTANIADGSVTEPKLSESITVVSTATATLDASTTTDVTYSAAVCALMLPVSQTTWAIGLVKWIRKRNTSVFGITLAPNSGGTINGQAADAVITLPGSYMPGSQATSPDPAWLVTRVSATAWEFAIGGASARLQQSYDPLMVFPSYQTIQTVSGICHFATVSTGSVDPFVLTTNSGAAAGVATAGRVGVMNVGTSTSATAAPCITTSATAFVFGSGFNRFRCDIVLATASDGTETYAARYGFNDSGSATPGNGSDGAYFRYTHSVNGGRWECVTTSNGTETATDSGVAAISASYQCLEVEVNAAGTSVAFYRNRTLVATNTTNIPTGVARATGINMHIVKSAGTTARGFDIDLAAFHCELDTAI